MRSISLWLAIMVGTGLSLGVYGLVRIWEREQLRAEFQKVAGYKARLVDHAVNHQESILYSVWAFCHSIGPRNGPSFQVFAGQMLASEPVFTALAFVPRIDPAAAGAGAIFRGNDPSAPPMVERTAEGAWMTAAGRPRYFPVWFVEPAADADLQPGWDLASDAELKAALDCARDTARMAVAVHAAHKRGRPQFRVYCFLALYRGGAIPPQIEERRRRLDGFVCGVFPMDRLMDHAVGDFSSSQMTIRLQDESAKGRRLIFVNRPLSDPCHSKNESASAFRLVENRAFANRQWAIEFFAAPGRGHSVSDKLGWVVLGGGVFLTFLLGAHLVQRRCAEESLRLSEEKYRVVSDNTYAWEFWLDPSDRFVYSSPSCRQITGYSADEFMNDPGLLQRIVHPEDWRPFAIYRQEAKQRVPSVSLTFRIVRRQGDVRWLGCMCAPVFGGGGEFLGTRGSSHDITEHKQAEQAREHYQRKLKALTSQMSTVEERERRRMAVTVHDRISQGLSAAIMKLDMVRRSISDPVDGERMESLGKLFEQLLDDSRSLTSELSPPTLYELGLEPAIEELGAPMRERFGLAVRVQYDREIEPLVDRRINGVLFRATCELLTNVAKHAGAREAVVSIGRTDRKVTVCVKDEGIGFDAVPYETNRADGAGFGLFSVREHLLFLGGSLRIESTPGHGTTATMVVPLNAEGSAEPS